MSHTELDKYLKTFEKQFDVVLPEHTPIIIRLDGRNFSSYTRPFKKPFDERIREAMVHATLAAMYDMPGSKAAFVQSDESSILVKYYERTESQPYFGNRIQKLCSVLSSLFTGAFNDKMSNLTTKVANFDCRVFTIPPINVFDYFMWRQMDCIRNSIQSLAQAHFSPKELHGVSVKQLAETTDWAKVVHDKFKYGTTIYEYVTEDNRKNLIRSYLKFSEHREFFTKFRLEYTQCLTTSSC